MQPHKGAGVPPGVQLLTEVFFPTINFRLRDSFPDLWSLDPIDGNTYGSRLHSALRLCELPAPNR